MVFRLRTPVLRTSFITFSNTIVFFLILNFFKLMFLYTSMSSEKMMIALGRFLFAMYGTRMSKKDRQLPLLRVLLKRFNSFLFIMNHFQPSQRHRIRHQLMFKRWLTIFAPCAETSWSFWDDLIKKVVQRQYIQPTTPVSSCRKNAQEVVTILYRKSLKQWSLITCCDEALLGSWKYYAWRIMTFPSSWIIFIILWGTHS